jgi:DNA replication protein DnaC
MGAVREIAKRAERSMPQIPTSTTDSDDCPNCRGNGFVQSNGRWVPCPCQAERRIRLTIPERYWGADLSDFAPVIFDQVMAWLLSPTDGLRLCGPVGTGKTHCAAGIVRHIAQQEKPVKFRSFSQVYRDLRECYTLNRNEQDVLRELFRAPFVVLDDLGAGSLSDFERRSITDILDERMGGLRPTVVTTNWSLKQIEERMDDRIASRLAAFTTIEFTGRDRRVRPKL